MLTIKPAGCVDAGAAAVVAAVVVVSEEPLDEQAPVFAQTAMMIITMMIATTV
jgi:hypothetical protein